jgi:prepilin-type N-terminal cleavage/methylation domain-containing protein
MNDFMRQKNTHNNGFTLIETLVSLVIFSLIVVAMGAFMRDVFFFNNVLQTGLTNVSEARKVLRPFTNEVRKAQPSDKGAFAIDTAGTSTFAFYSDIDADGSREKIRYFLDGTDFKKGITEPSGDPVLYDEADEDIVNVIQNITGTSTIFSYYDSNYYGSTTASSALPQPVTTSDVRLVRIDLMVDANPGRAPSLLTITTQATIRNLKDNYDAD